MLDEPDAALAFEDIPPGLLDGVTDGRDYAEAGNDYAPHALITSFEKEKAAISAIDGRPFR